MKILKDKLGNKITFSEFMKRWKEGIDNITPVQKLENDARGTFITLIGNLVALIAVILSISKIGLLSYGLILIFLGSIVTTGLKWLSLRQQLKFLKNLSSELNNEDNNEMPKM